MIFALAYGTFCPGPAHVLKPQHPKYSKNTYEQYRNAFPPTYMNMPVMGAWVPVEYRSDDIVVMRRNPYYWKVDEEGHQLPYLDELQYRLSTWADRDVQAVAGTGDFSNLEQPESYVEALKRSADPAAPARLAFGPRIDRLHAVPEPLGQRLGRARRPRPGGARAQPQPRLPQGGHHGDRPAAARRVAGQGAVHRHLSGRDHERDRLLRQGLRPSTIPTTSTAAKAELEKAGLKDTDGDGFVNFPDGGGNVEITLLINGDYATDKSLGEGVVAMMEPLGLRVIPNILVRQRPRRGAAGGQVRLDGPAQRPGAGHRGAEHHTSSRRSARRPRCSHRANDDGELDLLDFEKQMVADINAFVCDRRRRRSARS